MKYIQYTPLPYITWGLNKKLKIKEQIPILNLKKSLDSHPKIQISKHKKEEILENTYTKQYQRGKMAEPEGPKDPSSRSSGPSSPSSPSGTATTHTTYTTIKLVPF